MPYYSYPESVGKSGRYYDMKLRIGKSEAVLTTSNEAEDTKAALDQPPLRAFSTRFEYETDGGLMILFNPRFDYVTGQGSDAVLERIQTIALRFIHHFPRDRGLIYEGLWAANLVIVPGLVDLGDVVAGEVTDSAGSAIGQMKTARARTTPMDFTTYLARFQQNENDAQGHSVMELFAYAGSSNSAGQEISAISHFDERGREYLRRFFTLPPEYNLQNNTLSLPYLSANESCDYEAEYYHYHLDQANGRFERINGND